MALYDDKHCNSLPGSSDKREEQHQKLTDPQTKPTDLSHAAARTLLSSTPTTASSTLVLLSLKADTHFTITQREAGWVNLDTVQPVPKAIAYIWQLFLRQTPKMPVGFDPRSGSHAPVRRVTTTTLRPAPALAAIYALLTTTGLKLVGKSDITFFTRM